MSARVLDLLPTPTAAPRTAGAEPLSGYRLIAPLGRGGFGEVWKCEAPGGLFKAVKFVPGGDDGFRQEMQAFEQIRSIRHPLLLTLERVEVVGTDLVMVMELADGQLADRFKACVSAGKCGIPRRELLGYLLEAAEALDMIGSKYGLQHLDVKPPNVFVVSGHAKVGDYGLVRRTARNGERSASGGFTPRYTPPEVLLGKVSIHSDQYSLALVYVELLTGRFPFPGRSPNDYMTHHLNGAPDLSGLVPADRAAVGRALAKDPDERFASCLDFVAALIDGQPPGVDSVPVAVPAKRPAESYALTLQTRPMTAQTQRIATPPLVSPAMTLMNGKTALSALIVRPADRTPPPPPNQTSIKAPTLPADPFADLAPVMPVDRLHAPHPRVGEDDQTPEVATVIEAVLRKSGNAAAATGTPTKPVADQVRFFATVSPHMIPHKLAVVAEKWGLTSKTTDNTHVVLRKAYTDPAAKPGTAGNIRSGFEVVVELPTPAAAEVVMAAKFFGLPDAEFTRSARNLFPVIFNHARSLLQQVGERRAHPRRRLDTPVRVFPLFTDGQIGPGGDGRLIDLSLGGLQLHLQADPGSNRLFVQFPDVPAVSRWAVYLRVLRSHPTSDGTGLLLAGRYRTGD